MSSLKLQTELILVIVCLVKLILSLRKETEILSHVPIFIFTSISHYIWKVSHSCQEPSQCFEMYSYLRTDTHACTPSLVQRNFSVRSMWTTLDFRRNPGWLVSVKAGLPSSLVGETVMKCSTLCRRLPRLIFGLTAGL